ncbi:mechanosensitive ion channel family protein [Methylococcus sp. EFPC2]|uniref:mechanosensitive ion channel family protein n=1 Tax=Methylococcus sp. EFPC2 TaxID=2812648 RepID=UPI001967DCCD|nr:mechanosensitive ion channel domain-containing protein [Methylococcus sp. EFPC2]QSA97847.1 mechanosensitive ion channel [Methylococcus sp. EFPC2]
MNSGRSAPKIYGGEPDWANFSRHLIIGLLWWALAVAAPACLAAKDGAGMSDSASPEAAFDTAAVKLDGSVLFRVRGISALPAAERAGNISERIENIARDPEVGAEMLRTVESDVMTEIMAGDRLIVSVIDADAKIEGVRRQVLAGALARRIGKAIEDYRRARSPEVLLKNGLYALLATVVLALALVLLVWLARRLDALMERRWRKHIQGLGVQSFEIVRAERVWAALSGALGAGRGLAILAVGLVYLHFVLSLFPWTHELAEGLLATVVDPLAAIVRGIVADIPDLAFLAVLIILVRYGLKLTRFFFDGVARRLVSISGFEPQWAWPTYKILRIAVIAFALVVAYPYIPGSESAAFKGVSLFLGVVFSLGSSSVIANTIAGYALIYRRAFTLGDRVSINDMIGDVIEMRLQVTHLRSLKNEEIIVPNSLILNSQVINYSSLAHAQGLVLHTVVGIGYEVPWRQVEAMLLMAADRTPGLLKEPRPYILQKSLGDFAVNYELNVHCDDASAMMALYTALHRNILDVFNEYEVQIMTPAYVSDPEQLKVVPKAQWYAAPAPSKGAEERLSSER